MKSAFDDYIPFGDEYKAHLMKLPKKHLIDLFISAAKKNLITEKYIKDVLDYTEDDYAYNLFTDLSKKLKKV